MEKKYKKALFIFRRDLRLDDNTGLQKACLDAEKVIPCFIFDPQQIGPSNKYKSKNAIQFMIESLLDLKKQLKLKKGTLYFFYGKPESVLKKLIKTEKINAVFSNRDYTPFSIKRDTKLKKICQEFHIIFEQSNDLLLHEPEDIKTLNNTPYEVFSAFFKNARKYHAINEPTKFDCSNFHSKKIKSSKTLTFLQKIIKPLNKEIAISGGRTHGLKTIKNIKKFNNYAKDKDFPARQATTKLSAHLKFGTISIREAYHAIKKQLSNHHPLIRQLYWRDFFTHVAYHSPFVFGNAYRKKYEKLWWENNAKKFEAWCTGQTGFPIVDAGMRQLNTTGFMHNRARMITASFLIKDLHIDWLWGEKYFAQQLVDYDPAVNNGNWQWVASTGCDAQPYFRIFNPWLQQKKFDPQCAYIKKWIPELKNVPNKTIHTWFKETNPAIDNYPRPIVDHKEESQKTKKFYKKI